MAMTASAVLNRSSDSGNPCLVPDLGGKAFSLLPFSMVLATDFSYMAIIMLKSFPSSWFFEYFYHATVLNFVNAFVSSLPI